MKRELLPNGNSFTRPFVSPANWNSNEASIKDYWRIRYRYYDPVNCPKGKQFSFRVPSEGDVTQRRKDVREFISLLRDKLVRDLYNPITGTAPDRNSDYDCDSYTLVIQALEFAFKKVVAGKRHLGEIKKSLPHIKRALRELGYDRLAISEIRPKHIKFTLEKIGYNKGGWSSAVNHNAFLKNIRSLFSVLFEISITDINPAIPIHKIPVTRKIRETLTDDERDKVREHLRNNYPDFFRYANIFWHSGARSSELLRLKGADVDLENQRFKVTILKRRRPTEVWKTIKTIAIPFWQEVRAEKDQFVFSHDLVPGSVAIDPIQISRRWRLHVKAKPADEKKMRLRKDGKPRKDNSPGGLGINADFYSLKYSHTTEVVELLSTSEAAKHNSHTSEAMVVNIYDVKRKSREHNQIKGLKNKF